MSDKIISRQNPALFTIAIISALMVFGAIYLVLFSHASSPSATANLWIDSNSGAHNCTRSGTASIPADDYNTAVSSGRICSSLSGAYAAALPGDKVLIKSGSTYGSQSFAKRTALDSGTCVSTGNGCVTFMPDVGADIKLGELSFGSNYANDGPTNIKIDATGGTISASGENFVRAHEIYLKNINVPGNVYMTGGSYISVYGGEYGPFSDGSGTHPEVQAVYNSNPVIMPTHIIFSGGYWHDYNTTNATAHVDCLQIESGQDFILENSRFKNCGSVGVRVSYGTNRNSEAPNGLLIQNNVFDQCAPIPVSQCYYSAELGNGNNVTIRNNTFIQSEQPTTSNGSPSNVIRINNVGALDGCQNFGTNITYSHNIWKNGTCNSTDKSYGNLLLNADGSPQSSSSPVINAGDSSNCPPYDILGHTRPYGGGCDAGAYEFGATGGSNPPPPPPPPSCTRAADINCDGSVNIQDVTVVLSNFGKPTSQATDTRADASGNGSVDISDMTVVLSSFGS
jgi:hypothetical protein